MIRSRLAAVAGVVAVLALGACGADGPEATPESPTASTEHGSHDTHSPEASASPVARTPLRDGERRVKVRMPATYTPSPPTGKGTDDYRCFLLDPKITQDSFVTGFDVLPGNPDIVHHVILFRVTPDVVAQAERKDAATPGDGWTCFGMSGLSAHSSIDDAQWLGAWAPGGAEQVYGEGLGEPFAAGSRIVMQVHYNLLDGTAPDRSAAELRLSSDPETEPLFTQLIPAPVELPCRPGKSGPLCQRAAALADVKERFGDGPGATADLLHLLCGGAPAGPVQSCTRPVERAQTVRGVAGHMHLLGRSIKVETNPGTPRAKTVLDIGTWDFDDQSSRPTPPVRLLPGDTVKVTCTHAQDLRDLLPAFEGQPDRYVLWGDGTTDEMCLGILLVTRP